MITLGSLMKNAQNNKDICKIKKLKIKIFKFFFILIENIS